MLKIQNSRNFAGFCPIDSCQGTPSDACFLPYQWKIVSNVPGLSPCPVYVITPNPLCGHWLSTISQRDLYSTFCFLQMHVPGELVESCEAVLFELTELWERLLVSASLIDHEPLHHREIRRSIMTSLVSTVGSRAAFGAVCFVFKYWKVIKFQGYNKVKGELWMQLSMKGISWNAANQLKDYTF